MMKWDYQGNYYCNCCNCGYEWISTLIIRCPFCDCADIEVLPVNYHKKELLEIRR